MIKNPQVGDTVKCISGSMLLYTNREYKIRGVRGNKVLVNNGGCWYRSCRFIKPEEKTLEEVLKEHAVPHKKETRVSKRYEEYTFRTASKYSIDWDKVAEGVSRDKPLALIEVDNGTFGVLVHNSVVVKASKAKDCKEFTDWLDDRFHECNLTYADDATFYPLDSRKDIPKVKQLVSSVLNASWKGKGPLNVTVKIMEVA